MEIDGNHQLKFKIIKIINSPLYKLLIFLVPKTNKLKNRSFEVL